MLIHVHTDNHIVGGDPIVPQIEASVTQAVGRFADQLPRVEVFLTDQNGPKATGNDIRCTIETHPAGGKRLAVHHDAGDLFSAVDGAGDKLHRLLADHCDRHHHAKGRTPMGGV